MGNFYVNHAVVGADAATVVSVVRSLKRHAYVYQSDAHLAFVYDQSSDTQDVDVIQELAIMIGQSTKGVVFAAVNHDDDVLVYGLYKAGDMIDNYNSFPGYWDNSGDTPWGGNGAVLAAAFGKPEVAEKINDVLHSDRHTYAFELDRHKQISNLLNLPWPWCVTGYRHIASDQVSRENIRLIDCSPIIETK